MNFVRIFIPILVLFCGFSAYGQEVSEIKGTITDNNGKPVSLANITIKGENRGTVSEMDGKYSLEVENQGKVTLVFSCVGYETKEMEIIPEGESPLEINPVLNFSSKSIEEVSIRSRFESSSRFNRIDAKNVKKIPSTSGNFEAVIKTLPGVTSTNELSSQYSVRGGNYDENLVYVNDIEIYRPFLIRSGKQEGLSFINSDLISAIKFSAGGFDAQYGDKLSSVLDIQYKRPVRFGGSASMSFLGANTHLEGISDNRKFTYIAGARYKTNQYMLNSLATQGEYEPNFGDFQSFMTYDLSPSLEINFLGYYSLNSYRFYPDELKESFGTFNNPLSLNIYYDGGEVDRYQTFTGALSMIYQPMEDLNLKFIASGFQTDERETFDIQGQYFINQLDADIGSGEYGDSLLNIGVGTFLDHARNHLNARVLSFSHKGSFTNDLRKTQWGLKVRKEYIQDEMNEWRMIDSAGFSIPHNEYFAFSGDSIIIVPPSSVPIFHNVKSSSDINATRFTAYLQNIYSFKILQSEFGVTLGARTHYWDVNRELLISPRASVSYNPFWAPRLLFYFSSGVYYQPPFFKELRDLKGRINKDIKAQKSIHYVLSGEYSFTAWNRPFKWTTDVYYKELDNLIPYKIDNVQIRYSDENKAKGYATGLDMNINGEFVEGMESWASLSVLSTKANIPNDFYFTREGEMVEPGKYPRPTDQLFNFSLFFQDYLPNNPSYKMSLNLAYGSRIPFSSPFSDRFDKGVQVELPPYKRVDIGFSKIFKQSGQTASWDFLNHFNQVWLSAEVFNLFGIRNAISYMWVKTLSNQAGVPKEFVVANHLTSRRINLKLNVEF